MPARADGQEIRDQGGGMFMEEVTPPAQQDSNPGAKKVGVIKLQEDLSRVNVQTDENGNIVPAINNNPNPDHIQHQFSNTQAFNEPWWNFAPQAPFSPLGQQLNIYGQPVNPWGVPVGNAGQPLNTWSRLGIPGLGLTPPTTPPPFGMWPAGGYQSGIGAWPNAGYLPYLPPTYQPNSLSFRIGQTLGMMAQPRLTPGYSPYGFNPGYSPYGIAPGYSPYAMNPGYSPFGWNFGQNKTAPLVAPGYPVYPGWLPSGTWSMSNDGNGNVTQSYSGWQPPAPGQLLPRQTDIQMKSTTRQMTQDEMQRLMHPTDSDE